MRYRDYGTLLALAAIWGASFLFIRIVAPELPAALIAGLRVSIAALFLLPIALWQGKLPVMARHWKALLVVGLFNAALPFFLYAYAAHALDASFLSISNSIAPVWGAMIGWLWLGDRQTWLRSFGLLLSLLGVVVLIWEKLDFQAGGTGPAVLAVIVAPICYGIAANGTKRYLHQVDALSNATGSMISASLLLLPIALSNWPQTAVSMSTWVAVLLLAVICTGLAYILYYHLIAKLGPTNAVSVTFLVPLFGMLWGTWLLDETLTHTLVIGASIIFSGTALALGLIGPKQKK